MIDTQVIIDASDTCITDILDELDIEWKRENGWIAMRCIFHDSIKFNLKYKDKMFYCFSECHRSYSIIDVVKKQLCLSFVDSLKWLCAILEINESNVTVTEEKLESRKKINYLKKVSKKRSKIIVNPISNEILNDIVDYHHPYILDQGYTEETLSYFGIGFSIDGCLKNRITFPIDAENGEIISVSGRSIDGSEPKYYIVGNTEKSLTLYNYSRAKNNIHKYGFVLLVEGFKSVMTLHQWGYTNVVACMGSSCSSEQIKLLLRLGVRIVVCGDNDDAGKTLNQKVYNNCYMFAEVIKLPMNRYTDVEKDSIADLDDDTMYDLIDDLDTIRYKGKLE